MKKRVEFPCSQDKLFETVMNLAKQGQWPLGWSFFDLGKRNAMGYLELEVGRERVLRQREIPASTPRNADVEFSRRVGKITFAGINEQQSALIVRSEKVTLLRFFDDLIMILSKYPLTESAGVAQPATPTEPAIDRQEGLPRVPKQAKRLHDWKVAWRKIQASWKWGEGYGNLSKRAGMSPETVADIVKAGDAGLLD